MAGVKKVDAGSFNAAVLQETRPVLVDFWAEWCGPCRSLGPILEEIATDIKDQAVIVKVNVDENPEIAQQFHIRGIPTMIFFKNGETKKTLVGLQPKEEILTTLQELC